MKLSLRTGEARAGVARARAAIVRACAAIWAWRWGRPLVRALGIAGALVVLAAIGRSTLAGAAAQAPAGDGEGGRDPPLVNALVTAAAATQDAAPHVEPAPTPVEGARHGPASPDDPVFLNQATQDELQRLPGIGAKRAQAILALRAKLGRFRQVEDLMKVRGIGRVTMKRLRPLVRLDLPQPDAGGG